MFTAQQARELQSEAMRITMIGALELARPHLPFILNKVKRAAELGHDSLFVSWDDFGACGDGLKRQALMELILDEGFSVGGDTDRESRNRNGFHIYW